MCVIDSDTDTDYSNKNIQHLKWKNYLGYSTKWLSIRLLMDIIKFLSDPVQTIRKYFWL